MTDSVEVSHAGKQHKVRIAPSIKCWPYERLLSGKRGIMVILDVNPNEGKETLWAKELTLPQIRQMAASLVAMADEMDKGAAD